MVARALAASVFLIASMSLSAHVRDAALRNGDNPFSPAESDRRDSHKETIMTLTRACASALLLCLATALPARAQYSARRNGELVTLEDARNQMTVTIAPSAGNVATEFKVKGQNILRWPFKSLDEFRKGGLAGIPLLAPWANRLDEQAFYANGKKYAFDMQLGNVRGAIPIHGFLTTASTWQIVETKADGRSAWVTSRLDFYAQPSWMKQFPFAHTIEMTYRLQAGALEVATTIRNMSADPMPVAIGFHPYFRLTDSSRDEWTIAVGARTRWLLAPTKVPTGETTPIERLFPNPL